MVDARAPMDHRDASGAAPKQFQSRYRRRVLGADDSDVGVPVRVRFFVVVRHLGKVFAWAADRIRNVVKARRENYLARFVAATLSGLIFGSNREVAIAAGDAGYELVLSNFDLVVFGNTTVVFETFYAGGLIEHRRHREITDLQQFRSGEECHMRRVV